MKVLLCTSNLPGAAVIRWLTGSQWSHCAIVSDLGYAVEATWPRVRSVPVEEIMRKHSKSIMIDIPCADPTAAYQAALEQVGKPYDLTALIGWLSGRDWQEQDSWFCSELVAYAFAKAGSPLFRDGTMSRVTPQNLWMIRA
jgi:uncharacterized protein YycO